MVLFFFIRLMMDTYKKTIINELNNAKKKIVFIDEEKKTIKYIEDTVICHRKITELTDEAYVKAFLINHLINDLNYDPKNIEIEKEHELAFGTNTIHARSDIILNYKNGNPYLLIEAKSIDKFKPEDGETIEGQLYGISNAEREKYANSYLVLFTINPTNQQIKPKNVVINYKEYPDYKIFYKSIQRNL